jgi:hypothetical protein
MSPDKVADFTGAPWSIETVDRLRKLWSEGVPADMIAQTLAKPEHVVRAKAAQLGLPQHVDR